jgi:hypothetical protein
VSNIVVDDAPSIDESELIKYLAILNGAEVPKDFLEAFG